MYALAPPDIETQTTPAVRLVVERNLTNLKRARNITMYSPHIFFTNCVLDVC